MQFVERQKLDVKQVKQMVSKSSNDPTVLDRIHAKVSTVEQNIKNFKLKSRAIYENLHDQESELDAELQAMVEKFEILEQGGLEVLNEYQNYKIGAPSAKSKNGLKRPSSVTGASSRLLKSTYASQIKNIKDSGNYPFD